MVGPPVPSPGGAAFYVFMLALSGQITPAYDMASLIELRKNDRYAEPETPPGATLEHVDANGVPADWICAPGASADRAVLYLHGGGFVMPVSNGHRRFSVTLSRELDACVLLPNYRTAPEDPFPAPVEDSVHAFEYLRSIGVPAKRIVILGDSCGGTFALSAALMLRESGKELPAALVSPLFADVRGLPPTLLVAGTQDVLASDSVRMADHLREGGVPVRLDMFPGLPHDFPLIVEEIMEAGLALRHISTFVDRHVS